ncbi:MAG TPA: hypothetical protein PK426_05175 [Spirochaetota bacterium]|nr:hypothetical protein [Spirochaetota bacterium]
MKKILSFLILIYFVSFICSEENPKAYIGVSSPFMKTDNATAKFFNKQFIFEFLSNETEVKYNFVILNDYETTNNDEFYRLIKKEAFEKQIDYILYGETYTINNSVILKCSLINPYDDSILFMKNFRSKNDYTINDFLTTVSIELFKILNNSTLTIIKQKKAIVKDAKEDDDLSLEIKANTKHEIMVFNGFLKTTPRVISFVHSFYGYYFSPINFFSLGGGLFWGFGINDDRLLFNYSIDSSKSFFIGTSTGISFHISGYAVEPFVGLKIGLCYTIDKYLDLYIPIETGIKIHIRKMNFFSIYNSFQFTAYNLFNYKWENIYIIGINIGYAKKI